MLELAIWMYHIGNPDPVVRVITDVATSLVILWGVVNHYAKKESDKEFMDVYNEMRNWKAVAHYNAEQAQELRERLNEKWEDLPNMKHLGSVTDIKGFLIEPVDIITFGSPCQDLSIAGKRAGLNGAKSGLFWEAIRIIWEMLLATGGKYPRFVIWENVPGALSSNKGKDFEVVLNELLHLREFAGGRADQSILQHGKWGGFANYGAVAYRIVNAQWWGIPQRRRRVYAVCDTRRESAGVVVFERKGTEWNFEPCIPQGEEVTGLTADCYSWHDRMVATKPCEGGQREAYTMKIRSGCDGGGKGPLVQEELSATLATHQDQTLFELRNTVLNDQGGGFMEVTHGMTGTLRAQEHGHAPITFDKTEGNEKT